MDEVASRMRDRGHKWSRTTVYSIEHGARNLQLTEAYDFLEAVGMDPEKDIPTLLRQRPALIETAEYYLNRYRMAFEKSWAQFRKAKVMYEDIIRHEEQARHITSQQANERRARQRQYDISEKEDYLANRNMGFAPDEVYLPDFPIPPSAKANEDKR